jgi:hypothetical protein
MRGQQRKIFRKSINDSRYLCYAISITTVQASHYKFTGKVKKKHVHGKTSFNHLWFMGE